MDNVINWNDRQRPLAVRKEKEMRKFRAFLYFQFFYLAQEGADLSRYFFYAKQHGKYKLGEFVL